MTNGASSSGVAPSSSGYDSKPARPIKARRWVATKEKSLQLEGTGNNADSIPQETIGFPRWLSDAEPYVGPLPTVSLHLGKLGPLTEWVGPPLTWETFHNLNFNFRLLSPVTMRTSISQWVHQQSQKSWEVQSEVNGVLVIVTKTRALSKPSVGCR